MRLTTLPSEFQKALPIIEKIKQAGFEAYFVGGSVRDAILNRPIHDVDIATSAYPQEIKMIFKRTVDIGIDHGTVLVLENGGEYEVTTFRTEDIYVDYRRPSSVSFVRSLEEDLKRRDFTVNAFALDGDGIILDRFNGLGDLEKKQLKAVGVPQERLNEDALRIMRGFRFAASLDFEIDPETFEAMIQTVPLLEKISIERIFIEMDKLLLAPFWRKGLEILVASGAHRYLPGFQQFDQILPVIEETLSSEFHFSSSSQAWSFLLYILKTNNPKEFLKQWKTSNDFQKEVLRLLEIYQYREQEVYYNWEVYQYGLESILSVETIRAALGLETLISEVRQIHEGLLIHSKQEMVVNGRWLMEEFQLKPGPQLGVLLQLVERSIVEGSLDNQKEAIRAFVLERIEHE
ncbi:CCA tRNA nucleotidyltransferase [Streptococcus sp. DD13]|uniref:CCA tRNA nucleotidyltransferase n=1 Tax=Streptococcus sp. DD13 TaxID=1777881 RepID=UPI000793CE6E|nr:CCA tRNA nucleotidyltransferase [Streptococcus sp. DD13]KXT78843.1 tRNA nucleotidyltransferase [Streptococcus sp. DD13]